MSLNEQKWIKAGRLLTKLLDDTAEFHRPIAPGNDNVIKLNLLFSENELMLFSDKQKIHQIINNLVGNAIKFTTAGTITIHAEKKRGKIGISISDTGIGIPEEDLETVFDRFRQVEKTRTENNAGETGLGLAISKAFSEIPGGNIAVKSEEDRDHSLF